ncbi:hypothetical protein NPIL_668451 [Nephila pilipes]|uniref:Uncharacterized protein n=1 Tax=Nephila pilipes TaxID=299642 RepID=A0A8X6TNR0_NEPPI|nr:hypothetical protein NPIL_668451 [Nephila pilipes]
MAYLLKLKKDDMIEIARESGIEAQNTFTKLEIMNRIIKSESYEEEIVKAVMEGVLEEKREKMEECRQIREFELERMRLANITDRAECIVGRFRRPGGQKRKGSRGKMGFTADSVTFDGNRGVSGERTTREG